MLAFMLVKLCYGATTVHSLVLVYNWCCPLCLLACTIWSQSPTDFKLVIQLLPLFFCSLVSSSGPWLCILKLAQSTLLQRLIFSLFCYLSSKITVSIRYSDLLLTLPSQARVLAWPLRSSKRISATERRASSAATAQSVPSRLSYAEDALKTLSLPEGSSYLAHCLALSSKHTALCRTCFDLCSCSPKFYLSAYAEIVLNLPRALKQMFSSQESD